MDCMMTDFDDVKKALRANGFDMVPGLRDMKVLVIRDKLAIDK